MNGGALKIHTEERCKNRIQRKQGPKPTVQEPTLAEVQEENRQLRAQLQGTFLIILPVSVRC
jgi:hypothetical protein